MILSQPDLRQAVAGGAVAFDPPLEERQWGEASIDLRLGFSFTKLKPIEGLTLSVAGGLQGVADSGFWNTVYLEEEDGLGKPQTITFDPGEFILALTYESVTVPRNMIARVEGRSTYARVGLSMHQTAPWIQPGWSGQIVLEIMNNGPLAIGLTPLLDRPCQLTFFHLSSSVPEEAAYGEKDGDRYKDQDHPLQHGR